ncbi:MAG: cryptochrome/photolyase family protein, partial [Hyphococcus sp.]
MILVLGDQLSANISNLRDARKTKDVIVMGELADEAGYVRHHKKKIAFLFSAMRHFAEALAGENFTVDYQKLDDEGAASSFTGLVAQAIEAHQPSCIVTTEPGERRVLQEIKTWEKQFALPVEIRADDRFVASHEDFAQWAQGRKTLRMEYFYREMRKKTGLLMDGDAPVGGQWNYDKENRKPADDGLTFPAVARFEPDDITRDVLALVDDRFASHFGALTPFWFAVTRKQALIALDSFIEHALPRFGDYQDAMLKDQKYLFHSVMSLYINAGLLAPLEVCRRAADAYDAGAAPLNAVEGFIRQIIGWREYMRGVYWRGDEDYARQNYFGASRALPDFYWTGE